jgi:transcription initiation factor TFIIIB Brf1 subunit/transcription initiation factor TFIIB
VRNGTVDYHKFWEDINVSFIKSRREAIEILKKCYDAKLTSSRKGANISEEFFECTPKAKK